ncbi:cytochrome c biogenesis heme-transporting ATPase CcmA [Aliidiomarina halalkaliphila]|uniref:Cytochrome c biogenesis heme-transporting ATPase CcmA n=1 Tax=Aliidiomarina halalkaliphila TaxID=2593535 RepID=A0A552X5H7_9GAMM|nr:cytochrome c biogenesis heme-transporting ATPase CcmA [Aliidiomarina halalkaliphila]TRW50277.1 cytochrome c biogenesis heme-transporting ATPase CcmA [Aliidiomarina halalkaliphila]
MATATPETSVSSILLAATALSSIRGERTLFADLSMTVRAGEVWQIEGPNGAGKSSLLRILTGLLPAQAGTVHFQGESITQCRDEYHQSLLFIGHKSGVKPELTAIENLEFYAAVQGQPLVEPPYELLANVGLVGLEDIPAQGLSAGQQRRIALARLWLTQAPLWILDEPFTALDVAGIALLEARFAEHVGQGGAIILTSHQPVNAEKFPLQRIALRYQH